MVKKIILLFTLEITKDKIYSRKVFISLLFAKLVKRFLLMTKFSLNFQTTVEKADPVCDLSIISAIHIWSGNVYVNKSPIYNQ